MGGSYKQCGDCGKRALSIATRCPGCGREFLTPAAPTSAPAWTPSIHLSPRVVAGVLAAAAVLAAARFGQTSGSPNDRSSITTADSMAASSEVAYAIGAKVRPLMAMAPAPTAGTAAELLVARDWASVRQARSRHAPLEAVLTPGDTVLADSLAQGWYRVALYGEVLGYAHRSLLSPAGTHPKP